MRLDLHDPAPEEPEEEGRSRLRLVPRGPRVKFRQVENPRTSWRVRTLSVVLGVILTTVGVVVILVTAAMLKEFYDRVDAQDRARAAARARQAQDEAGEKARQGGALILKMPPADSTSQEPPKPPPQPPPPKP